MGVAQPTGEPPTATPRAPPVRPETLLFLLGLAALLVFLALEPYLSYALFGSDTGEYYRLTADLLSTGTLPHGSAYTGWGTAYPDFPGIFLLAGAGAGALGLNTFTALTVIVPVVAVLSVFPLFLLFRRLYPHDMVALLAAAFASVAMPRLFSIAHPAPLALGDFLCVGALWLLVESRYDRRYLLPLALTSGALLVTHHLSSYFFAVSALGGILFIELWRPGLWSRRFPLRELAFLAAFLTATFAYWFYGTSSFITKVLLTALGQHAYVGFVAFEALGLLAILTVGLLVRWRRGGFRPRRSWVRLPTDRSLVRDAVGLTIVIFGAIAVVTVVPVPGTGQTTSLSAILWFSPILGLGILCAGSRRAPTPARLGPFGLTWVGALGLSAGAMILLSVVGAAASQADLTSVSNTVAPSRHVEYLLIPVGLLVAIGLARLVVRAGDRGGRRAFLAASMGAVVLLAANAAIVYPPQSDFGGFEEGLTVQDAALWSWVGLAAPASWAVASDHRLSSMVFGFDGNPATWVTTPTLFNGQSSDWPTAVAELRAAWVPTADHVHPIDLVLVDAVMYQGVALDPSQLAKPLSTAAIDWFAGLPFVLVFEDGQNYVYLVDASFLPPG
jgi:hypothetical protein